VADEVHQFTCTIPSMTAKATPTTVDLPLNLYEVESIDLEVASGPAGLMGFYLALSGQQWIPWEMGEWLVWDNQSKNWPLSNQPTSEGWQLVGYNLGNYDHVVVVRFHLVVVGSAPSPPAPSLTFVSQPIAQPVATL